MSRKRSKITPFKNYESSLDTCGYEGRYIRLTHLQLICMSELSHTAFRLYIMMKDYSKGEQFFNFPYRIYKEFLSKETFAKARQELIDKKYLNQFTSNKNLRIENNYSFSGEWRHTKQNQILINNEINKKTTRQ